MLYLSVRFSVQDQHSVLSTIDGDVEQATSFVSALTPRVE